MIEEQQEKPRYYYKDFAETPVKRRYTSGHFVGWTQLDGVLGRVDYAVFMRPSGELLSIPEFSLTKETKALLPLREEANTF